MAAKILVARDLGQTLYYEVLLDTAHALPDGSPDRAFVRAYTFAKTPNVGETEPAFEARVTGELLGLAADSLARVAIGTGTPLGTEGAVIPLGAGPLYDRSGDLVNYSGLAYAPRKMLITDGTTADPVAEWGPGMLICRVEDLRIGHINRGPINPGMANNNQVQNDVNAALSVVSINTPASEMQQSAIVGGARTYSSVHGTDAVGVTGLGRGMVGAAGRAGAFYGEATRDPGSGPVLGMELRINNNVAADSPYDPHALSDAVCLWLTTATNAEGMGSAFIQAANISGPGAEAHVGMGFVPGSVKDSTWRDDSSAAVTLDVNGTHDCALDTTGATLKRIANVAAAQTAPKASAGASGALPAQVAGYLVFAVDSAVVKVPYYNA